MTEIQQSRYDQLLRRVADLKGAGSKVNDVLEELFPVIDVERVPGELLLLGQTSLCLGSALLSGGVGEVARIQCFNPVGSGKLVTISTVIANSAGSQLLRFATSNTALTTGAGTEVFRDRRLAGTSRPTAQIRTDSTVALTDAHGQIQVFTATGMFIMDENSVAVLAPGSGFEVGATVTASQIIVTYFWRERVAEPSELNF